MQAARDTLAGFGEWVEEVRAAWKAPGVAVGIVKGDDMVFAEGFGHRNVDEQLPVTPDTLFAIGSSYATCDLRMNIIQKNSRRMSGSHPARLASSRRKTKKPCL